MASKIELRRINRNIVYRCIYASDGISRQEIASRTSLSIPTILQNLHELSDSGLISTDGVFESTGGRRAKVIRCDYGARYAVGIDITRNHITISVMDMAGRIVLGGRREAFSYRDEAEYYDKAAEKLAELLRQGKLSPEMVLGVGISVPCIVDREKNRLTYSRVIDAPADLYERFASRLPYRVEIFNDANAAGCAEVWNARPGKSCFYLMLSNSVGGAMIQPSGIYLGDNCRSAEIGHARIIPGGRACYCGQRGCLNAYCSAKCLADQTEGKLESFFEQLEGGDQRLKKLFEDYLDHLSLAVVNLRMLYDCDIILGGYVGAYLEGHMEQIRSRVSRQDPYEDHAEYVRQCRYRTEAAAVGAGLTFIDQFIEQI